MVEVFAFFVVGSIIMMLIVSSEKSVEISRKRQHQKYIKKLEKEKEELYSESLRKSQEKAHNKFLNERALKLTPGYAIRRDGQIKKIPKKYLSSLHHLHSIIGFLPGDYQLLGEFDKIYSHYKL